MLLSLFRQSPRHRKQNTRPRLRGKPNLEALEDRTLLSADFLVGSASPRVDMPGLVTKNGTPLPSVQAGPDYDCVAVGENGDIYYDNYSAGGIFRIDHATGDVSQVLPNTYHHFAIGPDGSVIGISGGDGGSLQRNGRDLLLPRQTTRLNDVAVNDSYDIFFLGQYGGQDGVFKIDHATNQVSEVLDTSTIQLGPPAPRGMVGLAVGPGDEIVLAYQSMADANGIFVNGKLVLGPPDITGAGAGYGVWAGSIAVNGSGDIFFVGAYQGRKGVFEIDHTSIMPSSGGSPLVTQVLSDQYDSIAVWHERPSGTPTPQGPPLPQGPRLPPGDFIVGSTMTFSEVTSADSPDAPPRYQPGSIWVNQTQLFSLPWTGQRNPYVMGPQSVNDVATNGAGDIFFSGQYQGQVGTFKIDHATGDVSQVADVYYDFIAIGPGDSLIGTDRSGTIYRDGQRVLTEGAFHGQVAVNASGDIFFDSTYNDAKGIFKIDHASGAVTQVLSSLYNYFALGPGDEIVVSSPNVSSSPTTFIAVNGITVLSSPTWSGDSFDAVAVDGRGDIYFSGIYQGGSGVFKLQQDAQSGVYTASLVEGSRYNLLAVWASPHANICDGPMSPLLNAVSEDPSFWANQYETGKSPDQAAHDYWDSNGQWCREVDGYYHSFLHRDAEAAGRTYWISRFAAGADESDVVEGFLTSAEYTLMHAGDTAFVEALYQDVLLRTSDANGEQWWRNGLAAGANRADIVQGFLRSTEAVTQVVDSMYATFLHRQGDAAGKCYWVRQLQSGGDKLGQVAQCFLASDEFCANAMKGAN
jgi:hypothetical protein